MVTSKGGPGREQTQREKKKQDIRFFLEFNNDVRETWANCAPKKNSKIEWNGSDRVVCVGSKAQ